MSINKMDKEEIAQYLTFRLAGEEFGVDVANVREVLEVTNITKVPRTPAFMRGVINVRGSVVPIVDMRLKFEMPGIEKTIDTCVIVLDIPMDGETIVLGALVDSVNEVINLEQDQIEPPPKIGTHLKVEFIKGMGKQNEQFIIILDIKKVFSDKEIAVVQEIGVKGAGIKGVNIMQNESVQETVVKEAVLQEAVLQEAGMQEV